MKRSICIILVTTMVLSICGMSAIAEEVTNTPIATEENFEISVDEKHFVVLFEGEKYFEMSFEDAVANGYLEEFSSVQLGTFCCPGNMIKGVVYPDGTYYSTSDDENHPASSNTYEGYVVMLHNYTEHYYYFVRFLDTDSSETDIKTYFENAGFETSEEDSSVVTSEKITFEGETYQELRIDMTQLDENGYYFSELIILEGNHILENSPLYTTAFVYDKSVGDYITYKIYPKKGTDASLSLYYSYEGSVIAALLPNEIVRATDETDKLGNYNAVIYLPNFAQYDGEEIIILFKSYNENFFVRLTAFVNK